MRKICRDSRLREHLNQWAPETTITIAKMFFTTEGTELQRSQEGLLRSLLHQALKEPTLAVQVLTPHLSKTADDKGTYSWTLAELSIAFKDLLNLASTTQRFCFFVDGLDEYVPDLTLEKIQGASHWIVHEQPALVIDRLTRFFAR